MRRRRLGAKDGRRLAPSDTVWLHMDRPENRLAIHVLFLLDRPVTVDAVRALVTERLLAEPRFRSRVAPSPVLPRWRPDERFDLGWHVRRAGVVDDAEDGLERLAARRMSEPLDPDRPVWTVDVVESWRGRGALLVKVHHCIGDGVTLVRLLLRLTDQGGGPRPPEVGVARPPPARAAGELIRRGAAHTRTLAKLLLLSQDSRSPFRGRLGEQKRVAWSRSFDVSAIREAARRRDGTLNDLALAAASGAIRQHLVERGARPEDVRLRALSPVFLRGDGDGGLGNHFGLVYVPLPVQLREPESRLREVERVMRDIKLSDEATVAFTVLGAMGFASRRLERLGVRLFTGKASFLFTNVPGPVEPVHLAGARVDDMIVWAPVSGVIGTGLTLLSYAGRLRLGVSTDAGLDVDPARLAERFSEQLEQLLATG